MSDTPLDELKNLYQNRYVSRTDLENFVAAHHLETPAKPTIIKQRIKLLLTFQFAKFKTYNRTIKYLTNRQKLNQEFIKREQKKTYQIEGHPLDPDQISAVVASEDANLILAPAGSGKTATLLAKVDYLINQQQINPENILLIAFTNKVVDELKDRIEHPNVEIRTFHSLGNKIISQHYPDSAILDDITESRLIHHIIERLIKTDPSYAKNYHAYLNSSLNSSLTTFIKTHHDVDAEAFEALIISVLDLEKAKRLSLHELETRLKSIPDPTDRKTSLRLFHLYAPVYRAYTQYLKSRHLYDFSDMLNLSTSIVRNLPPDSFTYEYILVDEAQDLSESKCELLKAILEKCHKVKLFAVGDDWQSIYRFAGSNLGILHNFETIFARETYHGVINSTYRFGQPTAKISNRFIIKNPRQSKKHVVPARKVHTPIIIRPSDRKNSSAPPDYEALNRELINLYQTLGGELKQKSLQIISRYNCDIFRLVDKTSRHYKNATYNEKTSILTWQISPSQNKSKKHLPKSANSPAAPLPPIKIPIAFCSMHKAKGITRDIVFVINMNTGAMPATRGDSPILETMLTRPDAYPHAEERRLFYVAITRAKERTIIISDINHISSFVFEISPRLTGTGVRVCPKCHRGIMQKRRRKSDGKIYYSCSNYSGGCRHTE